MTLRKKKLLSNSVYTRYIAQYIAKLPRCFFLGNFLHSSLHELGTEKTFWIRCCVIGHKILKLDYLLNSITNCIFTTYDAEFCLYFYGPAPVRCLGIKTVALYAEVYQVSLTSFMQMVHIGVESYLVISRL